MPLGLYLHVPFCLRRCSYCDFVSGIYFSQAADAYLEALALEAEGRCAGSRSQTVYIGGGTPTSLSAAQLARLLEIATSAAGHPGEFSVEANPGTVRESTLDLLLDHGVTRLSLGVQTFSDAGLRLLGRIHDQREAVATIQAAAAKGFRSLSVDLIFGWPGQTPADWSDDLQKAVDLGIQHMSCYALSFESGTELTRRLEIGEVQMLAEETERRLFDLTGEFLAAQGFHRYEISSFCLPGHECLHNVNYWEGGDYIGLGPGAHSHQNGTRSANLGELGDYIRRIQSSGSATEFSETLEQTERARELAVIWLRLRRGIDLQRFRQLAGIDLPDLYGELLTRLLAEHLLEYAGSGTRLRIPDDVLPVADSVLEELV